MGAVVSADHALFRAVNARWTCAALDAFFPWLTDLNRHVWFWLVIAAAAAWWLSRDRRARTVAPALGATVGVTDVFCRAVLKPLGHRLRPEYRLTGVILRAGSHSRYGFPSNHAANCCAAAAFLSVFYPRWRWPAFGLAALVSYSRVYVGAHFPLDVLAGAVVGAAIGGLGARVTARISGS